MSDAPLDAHFLADAGVADVPDWHRFVSNEQILRRGTAISATVRFERDAAIAVAERVRDVSRDFTSDMQSLLGSEFGAGELRPTSSAFVSDGGRVIVTLPSFECIIDDRRYEIGATATVCQGDTNSKIWVRVTHYEDRAGTSERLATRVSDTALAIYESCATTIAPAIQFTQRFAFHIKAAYSSDDGITDVFNILLRSADPKAAFEDLRDRRKLSPVARLLDYAQVDGAFDLDDAAFEEEWLTRNDRRSGAVSSITPWTFRQGEAIVLIEAREEERSLRAWALCHSDALEVDATPPVREAAVQVSGKLASALAQNL